MSRETLSEAPTFSSRSKCSLRKAMGRSGRAVHSWTMHSLSSRWMLCFWTYCSHSRKLCSSTLLVPGAAMLLCCDLEGNKGGTFFLIRSLLPLLSFRSWPQPIVQPASSNLTPLTSCLASARLINLVFGLPPGLLPGSSDLSILLLVHIHMSRPSQSGLSGSHQNNSRTYSLFHINKMHFNTFNLQQLCDTINARTQIYKHRRAILDIYKSRSICNVQ